MAEKCIANQPRPHLIVGAPGGRTGNTCPPVELSPRTPVSPRCRPSPPRRSAVTPAREHAAPRHPTHKRCAAAETVRLQVATQLALHPRTCIRASMFRLPTLSLPAASFARRCRIWHLHQCIRAHSCAACWPCPLPAGIGTSQPLDHARAPPPWSLLSELAKTSTDAARSVQLVTTPDRRPHLARSISMSPLSSSSLFPPCSGGA